MATCDSRLADLITACHILHHQGVLHESGSVSIRGSDDPSTFTIGNIPAILICSSADLVERNVKDGGRTDRLSESDPATVEYLIHSSIYLRYPAIHCVVHSKAQQAIVYSLEDADGSTIAPVYNNAGFLDDYAPIFNPADYYSDLPSTYRQDLRITHPLLGTAMAARMAEADTSSPAQESPDHSCILLRANGLVVCNESLRTTVHKAIHVSCNADIQTAILSQRTRDRSALRYLSATETEDTEQTTCLLSGQTWQAWKLEMERSRKYRNKMVDKQLE